MLTLDQGRAIAGLMADKLFEAMRGGAPAAQGMSLLRTDPLAHRGPVAQIQFSGGVSEFIYGNEAKKFGDLGPLLAAEIRARVEAFCPRLEPSIEGIRATVVGASQYTIQLSGSTIYVAPLDAVPLRNVPVIAPALPLDGETIDPAAVARATQAMLKRLDLNGGEQPVAVFVPWQGSATFQRLDAFCRGVVEGLATVLKNGHPLVLAGDGDVGGLLGIHLHEEMKLAESGGVDRRARTQGVRLHRHRHDAGKLRRGAGGDQVADLSGQRDGGRSQARGGYSVTSSTTPSAAIAPPAVRAAKRTGMRLAAKPIAMPIRCSTSVAAMKPAP